MKIGMRLPVVGPLKDIVGVAQRAERIGLDMAWLPDSPLNFGEIWCALGAIAVSTERIGLGPMVTNLASRHPSLTAAAARTIAEAAPGRFTLGLGAGDSAVGFDTMRPATVAELERGVLDIRALMRGDAVTYGDFAARLHGAHEPAPIFVAATGPKTLRLAGCVSDGAVITGGRLDQKIAAIAEGAAAAGRPMPPVYLSSLCAVTDDLRPYLPMLKIGAMRAAQLEGAGIFTAAGFELDGELLAHRVGAQGDIGHSHDPEATAATLGDAISDEMAVWYMRDRTFIGPMAELVGRMDRLKQLGVAGIYMAQPKVTALPEALLDGLPPLIEAARAG